MSKLHPELWTLSMDREKWIERFIHPHTRVKDWDGIVSEAKDKSDIWTFPIFTE